MAEYDKGPNARGRNSKGQNGRGRSGHKPRYSVVTFIILKST